MASCGRPRSEIDIDQLSLLMDLNMTWDQISTLLGSSVSTLKRRARENRLEKGYSVISDTDLATLVFNTVP